ncbi:MAG: hypothetical protein ACR2K2_13100 [Mycobacteriales bacterium]
MGSTELTRGLAESAFLAELQFRLVEAQATLQAAEALDDPLLAQIAESDLADLRSLAARNDVPIEAVSSA